jgi:hypothetical protein
LNTQVSEVLHNEVNLIIYKSKNQAETPLKAIFTLHFLKYFWNTLYRKSTYTFYIRSCSHLDNMAAVETASLNLSSLMTSYH